MFRGRAFTPEQDAEILARYAAGESVSDLARAFGVKYETIKKRTGDVTSATRLQDRIRTVYYAFGLYHPVDIAPHVGTSADRVRLAFERMGLPVPPRRRRTANKPAAGKRSAPSQSKPTADKPAPVKRQRTLAYDLVAPLHAAGVSPWEIVERTGLSYSTVAKARSKWEILNGVRLADGTRVTRAKPAAPKRDRCERGHDYTAETTRTNPDTGKRYCLTCARETVLARYRGGIKDRVAA